MNELKKFTTEELQTEIDKRSGVIWPKYATLFVDFSWDDIDADDIIQQLGWDEYNEDTIQGKLDALDMPPFEITIAVNRDNKIEIVAVGGMEVSNQRFEIVP
jgi:hypothetical protein